jgi:hypothetical protein
MLIGVGDDFDGPKNQGAMGGLGHASPSFPSDRATNNDFVGFHATCQAGSRVANHTPTQAMQNEPRRLVTASQLTLELLGTHAGGKGCNQVGRPKPILDGKMTAMKKRSSSDRRLMSALLTFMRVPTQEPPTAGTVALRTAKSFRPTALRKILPAVRVTRKPLPEFTQPLRECRSWHSQDLRKPSTCIKWISISPQFYPAPVPRRGSAESHHIFHHFSRTPHVGTGNVPGRSARTAFIRRRKPFAAASRVGIEPRNPRDSLD